MVRYTHNPNADIWSCPCNTCTRLDWEAMDDKRPSLENFRRAARYQIREGMK